MLPGFQASFFKNVVSGDIPQVLMVARQAFYPLHYLPSPSKTAKSLGGVFSPLSLRHHWWQCYLLAAVWCVYLFFGFVNLETLLSSKQFKSLQNWPTRMKLALWPTSKIRHVLTFGYICAVILRETHYKFKNTSIISILFYRWGNWLRMAKLLV